MAIKEESPCKKCSKGYDGDDSCKLPCDVYKTWQKFNLALSNLTKGPE